MQALVGLFCFSLVLATGTCLECEHCSGFQRDCTGKLKLCSKDQDTCATILTETIIGKVSSFTIVKSCYQASKCLGSNNGNSFIKVNVNIECSSSPAGKIESEGGKALVPGSNELPDNQLLVKLFNRPKSRAAEDLNTNPGNSRGSNDKPDSSESSTGKPESSEPPSGKPDPSEPSIDKPEPSEPPSGKPDPSEPSIDKPEPSEHPSGKPDPSESSTGKPEPSEPPSGKPDPPKPHTDKPTDKPPTQKPTKGDAHQTVASFLLALSSLLLMNIVL